ncbi:MAG: APC family permease [Promethearchaeia archaeon]
MGEKYTEHFEKIGLFSVVILGIGSLTGAGIYSLVSPTTQLAGPAVIISLLIGALFAFIVVSFYSELVSVKPLNGGGFIFVKEAYGEKALYLGWLTWLANMAYGSLVAYTASSFIINLFQIDKIFTLPIAIGFVLIMSTLNTRGAKFLARVQIPLTVALVLSLIIGSIYLFCNPEPSINWNLDYFFSYGPWSVIPAAALLFVVFIGFEDICTIAEETKNPRKNIPRAYFIMLSIVTIIYLVVLISLYVSTELIEIQQSEIAFLDAVSSNPIIYLIVYLGAIFSLLTTLGISLMAQSRNLVGLSINDFTDRKYSEIDKKANAPVKAVKLSTLITILILISGQVEFYASITVISYMCIVTALGLTIFKFRKTKNYDEETFKIPLHPYSTIIGIILCGLLFIALDISIIFVPIIWLLIGLILYLFFSSSRRVYGTIFLVTAFFFTLSSTFIGLTILILGLILYLISIADRPSIKLTIAGLKFFFVIITGFIYGFIDWNSNFLVLIFKCVLIISLIISLITVFIDIFPLKELVYWIKKSNGERPIMKAETSQIVDLSKKDKKLIHFINYILAIFQMTICAAIITLISFFLLFSVNIGKFALGNLIFSEKNNAILIIILIIYGCILGLSGAIMFSINRESKKLGL